MSDQIDAGHVSAHREPLEQLDTPAGEPIRLYPGTAPGSEAWTHHEREETDPATGTQLIRGVVEPTLTPVLPHPEAVNGTSVIVAPGGGFTALAWEHEGMPMARWLAGRGIAAFVLKYRLAVPEEPAAIVAKAGPMPDPADLRAVREWGRAALGSAPETATLDGEQAVRVVRAHAGSWGLDPSRIGILGFSAGGTVATQTAATTDQAARPDFVINVYGAFCNRAVPEQAPPYFGVVAADDLLCIDYVLRTTGAWLTAGRPTEMHLYESGSHAFALGPPGTPVGRWTERLADWLHARGLMPSPAQPH